MPHPKVHPNPKRLRPPRIRNCRSHGFDGLLSKLRKDVGKPRRTDVETVEILLATRRDNPALGVCKVIEAARSAVAADIPLPPTTVHRLFGCEGLTARHRTGKTKGCTSREAGLAKAFELMMSAQGKWRKLDGSSRLPDITQGIAFIDGKQLQTAA